MLSDQETEKILSDLDDFYSKNHQQLSDKYLRETAGTLKGGETAWEISFPTVESPPRSVPCKAN